MNLKGIKPSGVAPLNGVSRGKLFCHENAQCSNRNEDNTIENLKNRLTIVEQNNKITIKYIITDQ